MKFCWHHGHVDENYTYAINLFRGQEASIILHLNNYGLTKRTRKQVSAIIHFPNRTKKDYRKVYSINKPKKQKHLVHDNPM